jgi:signal transduction histidine kinase
MDHPLGPDQTDLQALQLAYDRLQQQAQFQAAFLGTASHELRAPINQILSLHQLILEDLCENPAEEREFLAQAHQAMHTVLKNLDLLITLSKLDIGAITPTLQVISLGPLLAQVQQLTQMKCLNRHCRLSLEQEKEETSVYSDRQWLQQGLVLLIEAALGLGSRTIVLESNGETTLTLTCDGSAAPSPELSPSPGIPDPTSTPPGPPSPTLSPGFQIQLASRIMSHLQAQFQATTTADGQQQWRISLPST